MTRPFWLTCPSCVMPKPTWFACCGSALGLVSMSSGMEVSDTQALLGLVSMSSVSNGVECEGGLLQRRPAQGGRAPSSSLDGLVVARVVGPPSELMLRSAIMIVGLALLSWNNAKCLATHANLWAIALSGPLVACQCRNFRTGFGNSSATAGVVFGR